MNDVIETNPDVFYTSAHTIVVGPAEIAFLRAHAAASPRRRSRLCTHPASTADLHEMLIVHDRDVYVRPHAHRSRPESYHVIEGSATFVLFDPSGAVRDAFDLSASAAAAAFYARIPEATHHMLIVRSDWIVFHETTLGPFDPASTDFPAWAPDGTDRADVLAFLARVEREVAAR